MKRRLYIIILMAAVAFSSMAQTIGEAMYIYRNDGQVNGFLPDEILSVEYSNSDADGNTYDEIMTQIVNTADSVFMIPLAAIDSISFVTPKAEYKPGVINLSDQLMPYVLSSDGLSITFSTSTPSSLMPRVGDKLVTVDMNELFPAGFVGEVKSVSGLVVTCQKVSLEDVFDTFYQVSSSYGYQEGNGSRGRTMLRKIDSYGSKDFSLGTWSSSNTAELSAKLVAGSDLALKYSTQYSFEMTPTFHVMSTLIVNKQEGTYFNVCLTGDITIQERIGYSGGLEWSKDFLANEWVKEPVAPFVFFYVKPGLFIKASAMASITSTWTHRYTLAAGLDFSTKGRNAIRPTCGGRLASSTFEEEGAIDGTLAAGAFVEIGVTALSSDIDKFCFRGELGAELVGHAVIYNSEIANANRDTSLYEKLKKTNIALNAFVTTATQAEMGQLGISNSLPWNMSQNIKTWDLVPTFSNTTFKQQAGSQTSADASVDMKGNCLFPIGVGLSVRNQNGGETEGVFANTKFTNGNKQYKHTFTGLNADGNYKLYPKVNFLGHELLASPSAQLEKTEFPVEITGFEQTGAEYSENGFEYNGNTYSYKFECALSVELKDSKDVEDWGYYYRNSDGQEGYYSRMSFTAPYPAAIFNIYRNVPKDIVVFYPYVKFYGEERVKGEPKEYELLYKDDLSCPDENHPHWIDLGLPSGTLWRCCNEGASRPEQYGGYYWPQFNLSPSKDQIEELLNNTTSVWATLNGVDGCKFTGTNGASIFLPAAGEYYDGGWNGYESYYQGEGTTGCYYSSTYIEYDGAWPDIYGYYELYFSANYQAELSKTINYTTTGSHTHKESIRPVK